MNIKKLKEITNLSYKKISEILKINYNYLLRKKDLIIVNEDELILISNYLEVNRAKILKFDILLIDKKINFNLKHKKENTIDFKKFKRNKENKKRYEEYEKYIDFDGLINYFK